jgi:hypothetical protein
MSMNDFLKLEYEQCMGLVKYYDERHHSLMKYAVGLSSGVPSLLLGIYGLGEAVQPVFWDVAGLICLITMIGLLAIMAAIVQTRLYFVYPARQLNAIRKQSLRKVAKDFRDNQMYLDTTFNAFKWNSSHTFQQAIVALQVGLFGGLSAFSWKFATSIRSENILNSSMAAVIVAAAVFGISASYLSQKSQYHPDKSVHHIKD